MGGLLCQDVGRLIPHGTNDALSDYLYYQMLLSARVSPEHHLQRILDCTWGICFLGTPHSGASMAAWGERLTALVGLSQQTNSMIVRSLRTDSENLARIQNEFHSLLRSMIEEGKRAISITCFYEELPLRGVGMVRHPCLTVVRFFYTKLTEVTIIPGGVEVIWNTPRIYRDWYPCEPSRYGSLREQRRPRLPECCRGTPEVDKRVAIGVYRDKYHQ